MIPGGNIPGDVRKGRPARPKGLAKFRADDVGVSDPELLTTGEVDREMGEDD